MVSQGREQAKRVENGCNMVPFSRSKRKFRPEGGWLMNSGDLDATNRHITRRSFLGTTAAGSAVLLTGGLATLFESAASAAGGFPFVEATIPQLQAAMASG